MRCEIWLAEHKIRRPFDLLEPSLADVDFLFIFLWVKGEERAREFKLFFECRRDIPNRPDGTRDGMTCRELIVNCSFFVLSFC